MWFFWYMLLSMAFISAIYKIKHQRSIIGELYLKYKPNRVILTKEVLRVNLDKSYKKFAETSGKRKYMTHTFFRNIEFITAEHILRVVIKLNNIRGDKQYFYPLSINKVNKIISRYRDIFRKEEQGNAVCSLKYRLFTNLSNIQTDLYGTMMTLNKLLRYSINSDINLSIVQDNGRFVFWRSDLEYNDKMLYRYKKFIGSDCL